MDNIELHHQKRQDEIKITETYLKKYDIYYDKLTNKFLRIYEKSTNYWITSMTRNHLSDSITTIQRLNIPIIYVNQYLKKLNTLENLFEIANLYNLSLNENQIQSMQNFMKTNLKFNNPKKSIFIKYSIKTNIPDISDLETIKLLENNNIQIFHDEIEETLHDIELEEFTKEIDFKNFQEE